MKVEFASMLHFLFEATTLFDTELSQQYGRPVVSQGLCFEPTISFCARLLKHTNIQNKTELAASTSG